MFRAFGENKALYHRVILAALPLFAVCDTATESLLAAVIAGICAVITAAAVSALKRFLTPATASFAVLVIAAGGVGVLTAVSGLFMRETVESLGVALPLITVTVSFTLLTDLCLNQSVAGASASAGVTVCVQAGFLFALGVLRELIGLGSFFGIDIYTRWFSPVSFFSTPAGGLLTAAVMLIVYNLIVKKTGRGEAAR